ncbi:septum formation initiator [Novosphingobium album (ex Hu et al. 2023)]
MVRSWAKVVQTAMEFGLQGGITCDSINSMRTMRQDHGIVKERLVQGLALAMLLLMGLYAVAGPSGLIAWGENQHLLEQQRAKLASMKLERDHWKNRVKLLDPKNADPDLAGELLRSNLNVARSDEMVMLLH